MPYVFNPFTGNFDFTNSPTTVGGSTGQIQFNDSGSFGGDAGMTYDKTTDTLSLLGSILTAGGVEATPSHSFTSDADTGFYSAGTNILGVTTAGTSRVLFNANGNVGIATSGTVLNNAKFSINTNTDKNFIMVGTNGSPELASINDAYNAYQELRINGSGLLLNNAAAGNILMAGGGGSVSVNTPTISRGIFEVTQRTNSSSGGIAIVNAAGSASGRFWVDASNEIHIDGNAAGTANVLINSGGAGRLGVGITPASVIHAHGVGVTNVLSLSSSIVSGGAAVAFTMSSGPGLIMSTGTFIAGSVNGSFNINNSTATATTPVYAFRNATTTGMGTPSSGSTDITFTCAGTERARINISGITSSGSFTGAVGGAASAIIVAGQRWSLASSGTSGDFLIRNESLVGPVKIQFGGTTASFPSIENIGANIIIRSANATNATRVAIGATSPAGMLDVTALSDATIGFVLRAASAYAVNLLDCRDSAGSTRLRINQNFVFFPVQATTASAPAYVIGGMYFDTTLNKLRIGGATAWETVTSA